MCVPFLLTGMFMCVFSGEINGLITGITGLDMQEIPVNIAPLTEEIAKAIPIVFAAFLMKPSKQALIEFSLAPCLHFQLQ